MIELEEARKYWLCALRGYHGLGREGAARQMSRDFNIPEDLLRVRGPRLSDPTDYGDLFTLTPARIANVRRGLAELGRHAQEIGA